MKFHSPRSVALALGMLMLPAVALGQNNSYLPLPQYAGSYGQQISPASYARYQQEPAVIGSSVINTPKIEAPKVDVESLPSPSDDVIGNGPYLQSTPGDGHEYVPQAEQPMVMSDPWTAGAGSCVDGNCGAGGYAGMMPGWMSMGLGRMCSPCDHWFGGVYGLSMTRDDADSEMQLSFNTADENSTLLSPESAEPNWQGGIEARLGRTFCGGCYAWEVVYWGVFSDTQTAYAYDPLPPGGNAGDLNTAFDFTSLTYDNGAVTGTVNDWFDTAQAHRLRRSYEYHNVELNFLNLCLCGNGCGYGGAAPYGMNAGPACGRRFNLGVGAGLRYMLIDESFEYGTADQSTAFGVSPANEVFYNIDVENHLVGIQVGGRGDYLVTQSFSLFADTKFGIYNNYINHHSRIGGINGAATVNNGPNNGAAFDIHSDKNDVSFIGELRLGGSYQFGRHWRATGGYRAVAVTGVALPTAQIPQDFRDLPGVEDINSDDSIVMHGAFAGLEFLY